jgi:hypothetical protein
MSLCRDRRVVRAKQTRKGEQTRKKGTADKGKTYTRSEGATPNASRRQGGTADKGRRSRMRMVEGGKVREARGAWQTREEGTNEGEESKAENGRGSQQTREKSENRAEKSG